jgi:uncharacterized protein (TIGR02996 family)
MSRWSDVFMDPFLRAVCESPDDDLPRLVYADWLDEHEQPDRAAFIRLQCEMATLTEDSPRRREVAFLARQLEDQHAAEWAPPEGQVLEYRFARGFVEMVGLAAENLEDDETADLLKTAPLRRLWVTGLVGDVRPLRRRLPRTNTITALDLTGNDLTANSLRDLTRFPQLAGVRELSLLFNRLDDEAAQVLCGEAFFQRLTLIRCGANPMTDAGRQRLRDHYGDRVTFAAERDPGYLYAFEDGDGYRFAAGFGNDYTQLLRYWWFESHYLAVFDHAGWLLRTEQWPTQWDTGSPRVTAEQADSMEKALLSELGFEPATIRVRRFHLPDGAGVFDFPDSMIEDFDQARAQEEDSEDWLHGWLANGKFGYDYGSDDCWLNRAGEVTDT